jgi:hypothetical protein
VVAAVRSGGITIEEACRVCQLSKEELLSWQRAFEIHGLAGLRVTRVQQYRSLRRARLALSVAPTLGNQVAKPLRCEVGLGRDIGSPMPLFPQHTAWMNHLIDILP